MSRVGAACVAAVTLLACSPPSLASQALWSVDGSVSSQKYGSADRLTAWSLAPSLRLDTRAASVLGGASYSTFSTGGWSAQLSGAASGFTSSTALLRGEFGASGAGRFFPGGDQTGELFGFGRLHVTSGGKGIWAGVGLGHSWLADSSRGVVSGDFGAWLQRGSVQVVATGTPTWVRDSAWTDAALSVRWAQGPLQLDLGAGARLRAGSTRGWASGVAVLHLTGPLFAVASGGRFLDDPVQGFLTGDYISLGVRLARQPLLPRLPRALLASGPAPPPEAAALRRFRVRRVDAATVELELEAPAVHTLELLADLTDWKPMAFTPDGKGRWRLRVTAAPGEHRLSVRVDGGSWVAPPGVPFESDDFEGTVGLVVVP